MRFVLAAVVVALVAVALWPWISEFFGWFKEKYDNVTDFNGSVETETEEEKDEDEKSD